MRRGGVKSLTPFFIQGEKNDFRNSRWTMHPRRGSAVGLDDIDRMKTPVAPKRVSRWFWPTIAALLWACVVVKETRADVGYLAIEQWVSTNKTGPFGSAGAALSATMARFGVYRSETITDCGTNLAGLVNDGDLVSITVSTSGVPSCGGVGLVGYIIKGICPVSGEGPAWDGAGVRICQVIPPACPASTTAGPGWFDMGTSPSDPPTSVCSGGCLAVFSGGSVTRRALVNGIYHYYAEGQYDQIQSTASNCSSGPSLPTSAPSGVPADGCAAGQIMGQVNGRNVCVDNTTGDPVNPNAAPGTTVGTTIQTPATPPPGGGDQSGDGTVVSSSGGKTTTTTTTTDPTSGVRTIVTEVVNDDPQDSYCEDHPEAEICKDEDESTFGGSCPAFSCDGDAIQCAIAQEQHKRNCTLYETTTPLSDLGNDAAAGTDSGTTDNPALESNREEIDIGSSLDQSRWLTGACPASVVTSIMGTSFTLSFAPVCDILEVIGLLGVAVTLVIAVRIVGVF